MASESGAASRYWHAAIVAAVLLCLGAAGCGTQEQLTASETDEALALLDEVERDIDDGKCNAAESAAQRLSNLVLALEDTSESFQTAFRESVDRLEELVADQCEQAPTEPTGATGETGETGPTEEGGGGTPAPTPDTGGGTTPDDNNGGGGNPPPPDPGPNDGGANPDSGGVQPE